MPTEKNLRETILDAEPLDPERQQMMRDELADIVEPKLTFAYRVYYTVAFIGSILGLMGAMGGVAFDEPRRLIWVFGVLGSAAISGWFLYILVRGAEPLQMMHELSKAFSGVGAMVAWLLIFYGIQNPSTTSILWALLGLLMFLLMSFINLWNRIISSESTIRESLLRIEYRLADHNHSFQSLEQNERLP